MYIVVVPAFKRGNSPRELNNLIKVTQLINEALRSLTWAGVLWRARFTLHTLPLPKVKMAGFRPAPSHRLPCTFLLPFTLAGLSVIGLSLSLCRQSSQPPASKPFLYPSRFQQHLEIEDVSRECFPTWLREACASVPDIPLPPCHF